jgi:hypothetical protein
MIAASSAHNHVCTTHNFPDISLRSFSLAARSSSIPLPKAESAQKFVVIAMVILLIV